jgi:phospholipid/cholesterol/gamma-HCH transport system substrate-binding protein
VFRALASEKGNVAATIRELPTALSQAETTLDKVDETARILGPTVEKLRPAIRQLRRTNAATRPLAEEAAPLLQRDIRPFVREARPLVRELRPAAGNLVEAEPGLTRTFTVLNRFFNMLAYNKDGREPPEKRDRDEGYLFYFGWLGHQVNNLFRNQDAHGPGRPITTGGTCAVLSQSIGEQPELEALLGLTGALTDPLVCGSAAEVRSTRSTRGDDRAKSADDDDKAKSAGDDDGKDG